MPSIRRPIILAAFVCCAAGLLAGSSLAYVCHPGVAGTKTITLPRLRRLAPHPREPRDLRRQEHGGLVHPHRVEHDDGDCPRGAVRLPRAPEAILRRKHRAPRACRFPSNRRPSSSPAAWPSSRRAARASTRSASRTGSSASSVPDGGGFAPRFDARGGVFFHDGESKLALRQGRTVVEHLTRAAVAATIARTAKPLVTGGPIRSLSMDGPRVALAVGDTQRPLRPCPLLERRVEPGPARERPLGADLPRPPAGSRDPLGRDRRLPRRVARHPERHVTADRRLAALPGVGARPLRHDRRGERDGR